MATEGPVALVGPRGVFKRGAPALFREWLLEVVEDDQV